MDVFLEINARPRTCPCRHDMAAGLQHVRLVTVTGACVYESAVKHDEMVIDMARWPQGLYFLNVLTKDGVSVKKVVRE